MTAWYRTPADVRAEVARSRKPALSVLESETSNEAARKIEPLRGTLRAKVLDAIKNSGRVSEVMPTWTSSISLVGGLTDEEGVAATGIPASTWRPRRVELVEMNLVADSGVRRKTRSGRDAVVWVVA